LTYEHSKDIFVIEKNREIINKQKEKFAQSLTNLRATATPDHKRDRSADSLNTTGEMKKSDKRNMSADRAIMRDNKKKLSENKRLMPNIPRPPKKNKDKVNADLNKSMPLEDALNTDNKKYDNYIDNSSKVKGMFDQLVKQGAKKFKQQLSEEKNITHEKRQKSIERRQKMLIIGNR
jgi:hypothetical protein